MVHHGSYTDQPLSLSIARCQGGIVCRRMEMDRRAPACVPSILLCTSINSDGFCSNTFRICMTTVDACVQGSHKCGREVWGFSVRHPVPVTCCLAPPGAARPQLRLVGAMWRVVHQKTALAAFIELRCLGFYIYTPLWPSLLIHISNTALPVSSIALSIASIPSSPDLPLLRFTAPWPTQTSLTIRSGSSTTNRHRPPRITFLPVIQ